MINYNNQTEIDAYLELVNELVDGYVYFQPVPVRSGPGTISEDYVFSESDLVIPDGVTLPTSITIEQVRERRDANNWKVVRSTRDRLIGMTDKWALPDRTMTDAQTNYRQALRDITTQSDPLDITWPVNPFG